MLGGNSIYAIIRTRFEGRRTNSYVEQVIIAIAIFAVCLGLGSTGRPWFFLVHEHLEGVSATVSVGNGKILPG